MLIYSGTDAVEIRRLEAVLRRHGDRFLQKVFTTEEIQRYRSRLPSLAARFAAKEAVAKALGCGIGKVNWVDIEVLHDAEGKPCLTLHRSALQEAKKRGIQGWSLSLTHTQELAFAFVVAWSE
jgi:holo-[acyl-carrier protein] synthase